MLTAQVGEVTQVKLEVRGEQMIKHGRLHNEFWRVGRDNECFNYLPGHHHLLDKLVSFFFFQENIRAFQLRTLCHYLRAPNKTGKTKTIDNFLD